MGSAASTPASTTAVVPGQGGFSSAKLGSSSGSGKHSSAKHTSGPESHSAPTVEIIQSRFSGLKQLFQQSGCRDAFGRFLCQEKYTDDFLAQYTRGFDAKFMTEEMEAFVVEVVEATRLAMLEDIRYRHSLGAIMCNPAMKPATVMALALRLYPKFLKSGHYKRIKETGSMKKMQSLNDKRKELVQMAMINPAEMKVAQKAIATVDLAEVDRLLQSGSWLASMLAAVENLPVCVSLASANKERPGFPLVYVNACFERTTGYKRNEIVGQNCRFLQAGKAEQESIDRLTAALREAKPVRVAITNYRKDGMPFKNLLAIKPIFSETGSYEYVVGVQFDVTQDDATPEKLKLADQVIQMLPNVIVISKKEELEDEEEGDNRLE